MKPYLFEINNVKVEVVTDNETICQYINSDAFPCAMVTDPQREGIDGTVFVPEVFHDLSKQHQVMMLTHECGHVALGHLANAAKGELTIDPFIEAEADHWAASIQGVAAYVDMIEVLNIRTVEVAKTMIPDEEVQNMIEEQSAIATKKRIADFMLLF